MDNLFLLLELLVYYENMTRVMYIQSHTDIQHALPFFSPFIYTSFPLNVSCHLSWDTCVVRTSLPFIPYLVYVILPYLQECSRASLNPSDRVKFFYK